MMNVSSWFQLCLRHFQVGRTGVKGLLRHEILGHELLGAFETGLRNGQLRLHLLQLGLLQLVVKLHQNLAFAHRPTVLGN